MSDPKNAGAAKHKTGKEKRKDADGNTREVEFLAAGGAVFTDTGEEYNEEAIAALAAMGLDATRAHNFEGQHKTNAEIYFWGPETVDEKTDTKKPNPLRGCPLSFFKCPEKMSQKDDDGNTRKRLVCWFLTTAPTFVTDRNKKTKLVPPRTVVWVDISHALTSLVTRGQALLGPKDEHGNREPIELYECAVNPKGKRTIKPGPDGKPRQAHQMDVDGGRGPIAKRDGYRTFDAKVIAALKNVIQIPELSGIDVDSFPDIDAGVLSDAEEALALPEHAAGTTVTQTPPAN